MTKRMALLALMVVVGCGSSGTTVVPEGGVILDDGGWVLGTTDADVEGGPMFDGGLEAAPPPSCTGKTAGAGDSTLTISSSGVPRVYLLHVPASYDPTKGSMLVFNFHGFTSDGAAQEELLSNMNASADAHNYVAVYPYGIAQSWNAGACCGTATATNVDDIQFIRDMLGSLETDYCIDTKRIYATGM